jgi:hypothetical protein
VVIAIIAVLAAANQKAKGAYCLANIKQIGVALMMYSSDNNETFPHLNTDAFPPPNPEPPGVYWWFEYIDNGKYVTSSRVSNNVWRCPSVLDSDLISGDFYGVKLEGDGPMEVNVLGTGIVPFGPMCSRKITELRRPSQLWLIGDLRVPRFASDLAKTDFPVVAIARSLAPGSRTHQGCFQAKARLLCLHLKSRQPAATAGVPTSRFAMDTPKVGNGRIWLQIILMSLPSIPIENINAVAHDWRLR